METATLPTYKHIEVKLIGQNGNAFSILAAVNRAMKKHKCSSEEINNVMEEMKSGDYNKLLATAMRHFDVT